jgi:L-amino acid N-acyltransferase YncA
MVISHATPEHLPGILTIYNEVTATSTAIYTLAPVTLEDRRSWFETRKAQGFPVLVATEDAAVVGFSSFGEWRGAWPGYRYTVEHSVHVRADRRGMGVGRQLVEALFPIAQSLALQLHVLVP